MRGELPLGHYDRPRGLAELWFGLLAGPAAWFLHLNVSYSLVRLVCASGDLWLLHLATLLSLALAAAGVMIGWRSWRRMGEPEITKGPGTLGRTRFMSISGLALSGFFGVIILLAWIPDFLLNPCAEL